MRILVNLSSTYLLVCSILKLVLIYGPVEVNIVNCIKYLEFYVLPIFVSYISQLFTSNKLLKSPFTVGIWTVYLFSRHFDVQCQINFS